MNQSANSDRAQVWKTDNKPTVAQFKKIKETLFYYSMKKNHEDLSWIYLRILSIGNDGGVGKCVCVKSPEEEAAEADTHNDVVILKHPL